MKAPMDIGFIHDLSSLDTLRKKAFGTEQTDDALRAAAEQFEAIFTQMLFKSMRDANEAFKSNLTDNRTSTFYEQMADEQLSSALSREGSLGLADMIVQQFKGLESSKPISEKNHFVSDSINLMSAIPSTQSKPLSAHTESKVAENMVVERNKNMRVKEYSEPLISESSIANQSIAELKPFRSPDDFVSRLKPYAIRAARMLGTDPALLIAQAALETGWGKKVITNVRGNSHNLFNIKADPKWVGQKMATQTLEFHGDIPVQETASFRSYSSYQDSFDDYVHFLNTNPRYETALQQSSQPESFIRGLHRAGYATDPQYSDKVLSVFERVKSLMEP